MVSVGVPKVDRWGFGWWLAAATLDACRALLADLPSYGARWPRLRGVSGGLPRPAPSS